MLRLGLAMLVVVGLGLAGLGVVVIGMLPRAPSGVAACAGVDRSLPGEGRARALLQARAARIAGDDRPRIRASLRYGDWTILEVEHSQFLFLFFEGTSDVTADSGRGVMPPIMATDTEAYAQRERYYRDRALREMPGMPAQLAGCYAWFAVYGRWLW